MTDHDLTDAGPATPPPNWCLPDAEPSWDKLTYEYGGGLVATWTRNVGDDVWIQAEDRIEGGRLLRSAPRIVYWEPAHDGIDSVQAHKLAEALVAAADIVACAAMGESTE